MDMESHDDIAQAKASDKIESQQKRLARIRGLRRRVLAVLLLAVPLAFGASDMSISAAECRMNGIVNFCKSSFGSGTFTLYGDKAGDIDRLVIDVPNITEQPEKFLHFFDLALAQLAPRLTTDQRNDALKELMVIGANNANKRIRLGHYDWTAIWLDKHLMLSAQRRK